MPRQSQNQKLLASVKSGISTLCDKTETTITALTERVGLNHFELSVRISRTWGPETEAIEALLREKEMRYQVSHDEEWTDYKIQPY